MSDKSRSAKQRERLEAENTCAYCLYLQPPPNSRGPSRGNCAYHKEWIESASTTTCADMSKKPLKKKGIYELVANETSGRDYLLRKAKIRTRLFLVRKSEKKSN